MLILSLLCVFMTVVLGIMFLMALGARGIAEDKRQEAERIEAEKDEQ